jgi:hypothetical protein
MARRSGYGPLALPFTSKILPATAAALGPLSRTIPSPPNPGGVAIAMMVSSSTHVFPNVNPF